MPISQTELARRLKLSKCTVSKALRNDPAVAEETRKKVQSLAKSLDYVINPHLSAIAANRFRNAKSSAKENIAFIHNPYQKEDRIESLAAAQERAYETGYTLTEFCLNDYQNNQQLDRILYSRGIRGLIIGTISHPRFRLDLKWNRYAVLGCQTNLEIFPFSRFSISWFRAVSDILRDIRKQGYKKIGTILLEHPSIEEEFAPQCGAVEWFRRKSSGDSLLPSLILEQQDHGEVFHYLEKYRPDALLVQNVGQYYLIKDYLIKKGRKIPPIASIYLPPQHTEIAGIYQNWRQTTIEAVNELDRMLRTGLLGKPEFIREIVMNHSFYRANVFN
ncbi:MAG: LacI family DNA-binding transcriptional regulator [Verrucomicrobiota bacterium]